ncbi:TPA: prepilin-type N-terminal cleavage/methylation domain-containing protein [Legionella pneumophila]|uniref:PilW family protein n=1 Tax=Legionella pneumophila TaxID=446 RepID=UPI000694B495|nr:prepilin-type N-terminal cleavage/methylation domain-containing protein [Legionella pneumophila]HAT9016105.1 hypothetical protein [Legionella pneumophila subsp. pneumophila]MDW9052281.1 prepilin-type N-terminal cleavage/methylation domain-containing protein [Legionella pneumophila]MDW9061572.1 prepilin-type N-terminal cleavage/methylation domain-containing protein [Legionella pneumophila]MDW9076726.1 prepilin-type N-terminal cleavage/methylation domain-containing protein [Legionella pneumoph
MLRGLKKASQLFAPMIWVLIEMGRQTGFSLSEMLISLFLASIITIPLTQFYIRSKPQYLKAQERLEINFDLLWIGDLLSDSIRKAGFTPCVSVEKLKTFDSRHAERKIINFQIENMPQVQLRINRMSDVYTEVTNFMSPTQIVIEESVISNIKHPLIISDCRQGEVHTVSKIDKLSNGYQITLKKPLRFRYNEIAYLGEWLEETWFTKQNEKGEKTLHYKLFQTEELSPFIHEFYVTRRLIKQRSVLDFAIGSDKETLRKISVSVRNL